MKTNIITPKNNGDKPSIVGMIVSPGLQFERMKNNNTIWGAFWLVSILTGIVYVIDSYAYAQSSEGIKKNVMLDLNVSVSEQLVTGFFTGVITAIIGFFISAAVYKALMMFMGNDTSYRKILTISIYGSVITILGLFINSILSIIIGGTGQESYTGLGPLFLSTSNVVHTIMNSFEIFTIWGLMVYGLGLYITAGLSKKQAVIAVLIFFIISLTFNLLGNMISAI
jgi:hypothetical protein